MSGLSGTSYGRTVRVAFCSTYPRSMATFRAARSSARIAFTRVGEAPAARRSFMAFSTCSGFSCDSLIWPSVGAMCLAMRLSYPAIVVGRERRVLSRYQRSHSAIVCRSVPTRAVRSFSRRTSWRARLRARRASARDMQVIFWRPWPSPSDIAATHRTRGDPSLLRSTRL